MARESNTGNERMKKVIACGQFTTCAKLLEADWNRFKQEPYFVYKVYKK